MQEFDWNSRLNIELAEMAKSRGEELIGHPTGTYDPRRTCEYRHFKLACGHTRDFAIKHYKLGSYICQTCYDNDIDNIAASHGLKLKSKEIFKFNKREFLMPCGHSIFQTPAYLRKHKPIECQECLWNEVLDNLEIKNFTLLEKVKQGYRYSCNTCGYIQVSDLNVCRNGTPSCPVCFEDRLARDAEASGFIYLKDKPAKRIKTNSRETLYRWYSCMECGYEDTFGHIAMRIGNVKCSNCYKNTLISDAERQGMEYLGHYSGMLHKYRLDCGCERTYQPFTVRMGIWACKQHGDTYYHRPSGVYLLKITSGDFSWLKFGFAKEMSIRIKGYRLPEDSQVEIIFYKQFDTGYEAMEVEKKIHKCISDARLNPSEMKKYMTGTGHTECYPVELKEVIINKMEEVCVK